MGTPIAKFTAKDAGCIADGTFGHAHCRARLAELCEYYGAHAYAAELRNEMSDDASEEDDAIAFLTEFCCEGVYFDFRDGDLMLLVDGEGDGEGY